MPGEKYRISIEEAFSSDEIEEVMKRVAKEMGLNDKKFLYTEKQFVLKDGRINEFESTAIVETRYMRDNNEVISFKVPVKRRLKILL